MVTTDVIIYDCQTITAGCYRKTVLTLVPLTGIEGSTASRKLRQKI
jgi:hypothetical protein